MAKTEKRVPRPYENLVRVIGAEATLRLCQEYGGEVLYIPKVDKLDALTRNASIRQKWNGRNAAESRSTAYRCDGFRRPWRGCRSRRCRDSSP